LDGTIAAEASSLGKAMDAPPPGVGTALSAEDLPAGLGAQEEDVAPVPAVAAVEPNFTRSAEDPPRPASCTHRPAANTA
jgi:hypothetical protein